MDSPIKRVLLDDVFLERVVCRDETGTGFTINHSKIPDG
jgi:hypothetical protein